MANPTGKGGFQKGKSGNPNGAPPKNRALTAILEAAGDIKIDHNGKKVTRKEVIADLLWQMVTTGKAILPENKTLELAPQDLLGLLKFIYNHVDGPPKAELDVTSNGETIIPILKTGMDVDEL